MIHCVLIDEEVEQKYQIPCIDKKKKNMLKRNKYTSVYPKYKIVNISEITKKLTFKIQKWVSFMTVKKNH